MDLDKDLISISNYVSTQMKDSFEYKSRESEGGLPIHYKKNGINDKCIVYNIGLATIFITKEIPAHNNTTKQKFKLDGSIYIDAYYNGFVEGKQYFNDNFKTNPFQSKETIVKDLHRYYYHQPTEKGNGIGWKDFIGKSTPTTLSNKNIETWGFYNGIVFELKEFIKLNAELCKDIDKCSNDKEHKEIHYFPFTNKKIFNKFKTYTENNIVEPYVDYSYLFQRLLDEHLIFNIKHIYFMEYLKDNDFISEKTLDKFLKQQSFRSLKKSYSTQRENNFNNIFS